MAFRGERFTIDLDDDDGVTTDEGFVDGFVADVRERDTWAAIIPPTPPQLASSMTGFPSHRRRNKPSVFKRQRDPKQPVTHPSVTEGQSAANQHLGDATQEDEKRSIDEENKQRMASMSTAEIERERAELMSALSPSLIDRLLKRGNIDDGGGQANANPEAVNKEEEEEEEESNGNFGTACKSASVDNLKPSQQDTDKALEQPDPSLSLDDLPPPHPPEDLCPASQPPSSRVHFPKPPARPSAMPNLDPSSPSFLADLQTHYFPDIPPDVSSLSWLKPSDDEPPTSAYHPESPATSLAPASLRFSLTGAILAPRTSLSLPTSIGLHHHAKDPEAAGYTIPELAILSRSSVPAQRCLAWQVLGRILYRLGKGEFGEKGSSLVEGLWSVVERENVVAGMLNEAGGGIGEDGNGKQGLGGLGGIGRHASARAWATEGVWLWRQGGGGDRGLLRKGEMRSK
ncbi:hypothetical protein PRK78_003063 [Emydomyces testavorans]|uniref:Transcription factor Rba50 n=1 Tax=Emydomyces testavorans TaxID=2070801 RepID=A0AAF0IIE9_9EURO|nr:hypothetical protein PRK78_003063 [Emydomyces testavorans]